MEGERYWNGGKWVAMVESAGRGARSMYLREREGEICGQEREEFDGRRED